MGVVLLVKDCHIWTLSSLVAYGSIWESVGRAVSPEELGDWECLSELRNGAPHTNKRFDQIEWAAVYFLLLSLARLAFTF